MSDLTETKESYPGEIRDLVNWLDGDRQELGRTRGPDDPLFKLVDRALTSDPFEWDLVLLREARAAVVSGSAHHRTLTTSYPVFL